MQRFKEILLIDDDPITNFLNEKVLRKLNIAETIRIAVNGQEAIEMICLKCHEGGDCPELIFLDINMPIMDGFEFLNHFKKAAFTNKEKVKIVILSTSTNPHDIEMARKENIKMLGKPLTDETVASVLKG